MAEIFVCPERVERDGVLIAFKGERMSEEEAAKRGILPEPKKPSKKRAKKED